MPYWSDAVCNHSEATPGPWAVRDMPEGADAPYEVWAENCGHLWSAVAAVLKTPTGSQFKDRDMIWAHDREAAANARLIADAPALLALLAQVADQLDAARVRPMPYSDKWAKLYLRIAEMVRRHVMTYHPAPADPAAPADGTAARGGDEPVPL